MDRRKFFRRAGAGLLGAGLLGKEETESKEPKVIGYLPSCDVCDGADTFVPIYDKPKELRRHEQT